MARVARAIAIEPAESLERVREKLAERRDRAGHWEPYEPLADAEERIHRALGVPWPCHARDEFGEVWTDLIGRLELRGVPVGRGTFGGWDDGDPGLLRMVWCLTSHLQPRTVIETGVARGLTTATVLRVLQKNGGHLWSIDLPPLAERSLSRETGIAVSEAESTHWTLLRGSTRRLLPSLVGELGTVDLFIHDSMHTGRNVGFELGCVWPALRPGGAAVVDDIDRNAAFGQFGAGHPNSVALPIAADDGRALFGCLVKA
jgi:hypothetical protein